MRLRVPPKQGVKQAGCRSGVLWCMDGSGFKRRLALCGPAQVLDGVVNPGC